MYITFKEYLGCFMGGKEKYCITRITKNNEFKFWGKFPNGSWKQLGSKSANEVTKKLLQGHTVILAEENSSGSDIAEEGEAIEIWFRIAKNGTKWGMDKLPKD